LLFVTQQNFHMLLVLSLYNETSVDISVCRLAVDVIHSTESTVLTMWINIFYSLLVTFNIQEFYALPTLYLCVLYLSENKQRLVPLTA